MAALCMPAGKVASVVWRCFRLFTWGCGSSGAHMCMGCSGSGAHMDDVRWGGVMLLLALVREWRQCVG